MAIHPTRNSHSSSANSENSAARGHSFAPKSSFIENADYNPDTEKLTLTFKSGSQYAYQNISPSTWLSFQQSPDPSSFYANALKGNSQSIPIKRALVGKSRSNPLHKFKEERTLSRYAPANSNSKSQRSNPLALGLSDTLTRAGLRGKGTIPHELYS